MTVAEAERPSTAGAPTLLDKALVYVTGKGGAGKTTVAAALGLAAAARGRRAIVCDLAGSDQLLYLFVPRIGPPEYEALARELSRRRPA